MITNNQKGIAHKTRDFQSNNKDICIYLLSLLSYTMLMGIYLSSLLSYTMLFLGFHCSVVIWSW